MGGASIAAMALMVAGRWPDGFEDVLGLVCMPVAVSFLYNFVLNRPINVGGGSIPSIGAPSAGITNHPVLWQALNALVRLFMLAFGLLYILNTAGVFWGVEQWSP